MRVKVVSQASKTTSVRISAQRRNEEMVRFAAVQIKALQSKKLGFPVHLGQL